MIFFKNNNWKELDDNELLRRYRNEADSDIPSVLYGRYIDVLYAVCLKYCPTKEDAQDAVLQVFEELPDKLKKHAPENFKAWIYTVVKNHCLMQLRKLKKGRVVSIEDSFMQLPSEEHLKDDLYEKELELGRLADCIAGLSQAQKQSIELFYLGRKCYKEIVEITKLEFDKVRSLIQNGKRNLKICMENKMVK